MESYDPEAVFSSIDHGGRYAYRNQPLIARWNLARLAEALLPLLAADGATPETAVAQATEVIDAFPGWYDEHWRAGQRAKLGLQTAQPDDAALADDWLALLHAQQIDFTLAWRYLAEVAEGRAEPLRDLFVDRAAADGWLQRWRARGEGEGGDGAARAAAMRAVSPIVIPRNHLVEEALAAAVDHDDLAPFERLLDAVTQPFAARAGFERHAEPAPRELTAGYRTFCGT